MYITYDIACMLQKHLMVPIIMITNCHQNVLFCLQISGRTELLERISLYLPSFHCYGHKASCQVSTFVKEYQEIIDNTSRFCLVHGGAKA